MRYSFVLIIVILFCAGCGDDDKKYTTTVQGAYSTQNDSGNYTVLDRPFKPDSSSSGNMISRRMVDCVGYFNLSSSNHVMKASVNDSYPLKLTVTVTNSGTSSSISATLTLGGIDIPQGALIVDVKDGMEEAMCRELRTRGIPTTLNDPVSVPVTIHHN